MATNDEIKFYVDTLILETAFSRRFVKAAGEESSLIDAASSYFDQHYDENDKVGSMISALSPGLTYAAFQSFGFGSIGLLLGLAQSVFNFNIKDIFDSICSGIKSLISGGKETTSDAVERVVTNAVNAHTPKLDESDAQNIAQKLQKSEVKPFSGSSTSSDAPELQLPGSSSPAASTGTQSSSDLSGFSLDLPFKRTSSFDLESDYKLKIKLREAKLLNLAFREYEANGRYLLTSEGDSLLGSLLGRLGSLSGKLISVFSWFFRGLLASGGFMIAGDAINKMLGRPNAFDGTLKGSKKSDSTSGSKDPKKEDRVPSSSLPPTNQNTFKLKSSYSKENFNTSGNRWLVKTDVTPSNIENLLIKYAKDVYEGLDGLEDIIRNAATFKVILNTLVFENRSNMNTKLLVIPSIFKSKKDLADSFIDEVASKVK